MAATATSTSEFHHFMSLPLELRYQIWEDALPEESGPVLYFYKTGDWCLQDPLSRYEPCYSEENALKAHYKYRHDMLDAAQVKIPIFFVNREARRIALAWIYKHNIQIRDFTRKHESLPAPVFVKPFDPKDDTLYIAINRWTVFFHDPVHRWLGVPWISRMVCIHPASITRIAIPKALFRGKCKVAAQLAELLVITIPFSCYDLYFADFQKLQEDWFCNIQSLSIVVDAPMDLKPVHNGMKMQSRWELKNLEGGAFIWNRDHRRFDFIGTKDAIDEALYNLIMKINKRLSKALVDDDHPTRSFEVRPVYAIKT